ncbi:cytochrome b/b6 domain-containing protein [Ciceribacter sp. L1K23]|nr:cytochrome b/b6 domain-containing protein [Ciceribacter sp. L1K23]
MVNAEQDMPGTASGRIARPDLVKVWDPLVRLFHWSLVGFFAFSFLTGDEWKSAHIISGYIIAALICVRLLWGVIGSEHARFSSFVYSPVTVARFLADSVAMRAKRYVGHNPAGGVMVIALLLMVSGIVTTGYMMTTDAYWGIEWVEDTHKTLVYSTLVLIALHVGGVIFASIEHRENLVRSMITGWKRRH